MCSLLSLANAYHLPLRVSTSFMCAVPGTMTLVATAVVLSIFQTSHLFVALLYACTSRFPFESKMKFFCSAHPVVLVGNPAPVMSVRVHVPLAPPPVDFQRPN